MLERLDPELSREAGSFVMDNVFAVAAELERIKAMEIDNIPYRIFPTLAAGDDLTLAAANFGIERKEAKAAEVLLKICGAEGTALDSEICACCRELVYRLAQSGVIPPSGEIILPAAAEEKGAKGNIPANTINEFVSAYSGLDSVTNPAAAYGGMDEEADEDLRLRVISRWQKPGTGGSAGDYISWALSVPGVKRARVFNPSAGNVSVYIIGDGDMVLLGQEVLSYIEERRPIGANVSVAAAEEVLINISVNIVREDGYTLSGIQNSIEERLASAFAAQAFVSNTVSYAKLAECLFVPGVADVSSYTINGGTSSISLADDEFAVLGTLVVS